MTLLEEFIFSLSSTERAKIRILQFRGVKRNIFSRILHCQSHLGLGAERTSHQYKLSSKRYYQIHSEMLEAACRDLVPENSIRLLLVLGNKQLFRHFLIEMRRQETLNKKRGSRKLEEFYFKVLAMRQLFLLNEAYHSDLIGEFDSFADRYISVKSPHPDDSLFVRVIEMNREISAQKKFSLEKIKIYLSEYEKIFAQLKEGSHALAQFLVADRLMLGYSYGSFGISPEYYARYVLSLMREHPKEFAEISDFYEIECSQFLPEAERHSTQEIKDFLYASSARYGASLFYVVRFFARILEEGDFTWIRKFIGAFFPYDLDILKPDAAVSWAFLYVQLYAHTGEYAKGEDYLRKAFRYNKGKNRSISTENYLRCYDAFFLAMEENASAAERRLAKHLRFVKNHGYKEFKKIYYFLKWTLELMHNAGINQEKAKKIREDFLKMEEVRPFTFLFRKIYEKYSA